MPGRALLPLTLAVFASGCPVAAQCEPEWGFRAGLFGTDDRVLCATYWDPDGAGPMAERAVIGGTFQTVARSNAPFLAQHDPATGEWFEIGGGALRFGVQDVEVAPDHTLVIAGAVEIGGQLHNGVARWDGVSWQALGPSFSAVRLAIDATGEIVACGTFTTIGATLANRVARWDGTSWQAMGAGNSRVEDVAAVPGGGYAAVFGSRLARWDGSSWQLLGSSWGTGSECVAVAANGDIFVGTANGMQYWDGSSLSQLVGPNSTVRDIVVLPNGDVVAGGQFFFATAAGPLANHVARYDGAQWHAMGDGYAAVCTALARAQNGDVVAAGREDNTYLPAVQRWDGTMWDFFGGGFSGETEALLELANGDIVVGGRFRQVGGITVNGLARWDGATWHAFGAGVDDLVRVVAELPNGNILVAGAFQSAGGTAAPGLAEWNGASWLPFVGGSPGGPVSALAVSPAGVVHVAYSINGVDRWVARWTGTSWQTLGGSFNGNVFDLVANAAGVFAGGYFTMTGATAARNVAFWDGSGWQDLAGGVSGTVWELGLGRNGDLLAAGSFGAVGTGNAIPTDGIGRWNGTSWQGFEGGPWQFEAVAELPDGRLVAGNADRLARWNGSGWDDLALFDPGSLRELVVTESNAIWIATWSQWSGTVPIGGLASIVPPCEPSATPVGAGCSGSAGPIQLAPSNQPWLDSTFRSVAVTVANGSLAVAVYGFSPWSQPLVNLSPLGLPGCTAFVMPEVVLPAVPQGGVVEMGLPLGAGRHFAGLVCRHQLLSAELTPQGSVSALAASNALELTLGTY